MDELWQRVRLQKRAGRGGAVAVLAFLLRRHFAKRLACPGHEKDRVVAESRLASPLGYHLAAALALEEPRIASGHRERDHADEPRLPWPRHSLQPPQELGRPFLLRWAQPGRFDAWKSIERFDLQARVVAQRRQSRFRQRGFSLQASVFGVALPHLLDLAVERDQLDA